LGKTTIQVLLVAMFWGGAFAAGKVTVEYMHPLAVAFYRFFLTALCLFPFMLWREKEKARLAKADIPWMLLLGLTGIFAYNAFFFMGLKFTTAINATTIIATVPMVTTVANSLIFKDKITIRQAAGILLSFFGVYTVVSKGDYFGLAWNTGDLFLIGSLVSWSIYTLAGKKVMRTYSALTATTYAVGFGTIMLAPFAIYYGALQPTSSILAWGLIGYMAFFSSVLGFVWWYNGVKELGPTRTVIFLNLVPIFATIGALAIGEKLYWPQLVGMVIVIAGVLFTNLPSKQVTTLHSPKTQSATDISSS
jgi:drug/metabolite transporter (DMT)-like permease